MSMPSVSPAQAAAFKAAVIAVLCLDEDSNTISPAPFTEANVRWSDQPHSRAAGPSATLQEIAFVDVGGTETLLEKVAAEDPEDPPIVTQWHRTPSEWTVRVQVSSRLDDAEPRLEQAAPYIIQRLRNRFLSETFGATLRAVGLAPLRRGPLASLSALVRGSQNETRAALDLVLSAMPMVGERVHDIATVGLAMTIDGRTTNLTLPEP